MMWEAEAKIDDLDLNGEKSEYKGDLVVELN